MRTRWLVAVVCVMLLGGGLAFASGVGNNPEKTGWRWDIGFERSEREVELDEAALMYEAVESYEYNEDDYGTETYREWLQSFNGRETLDKYFLQAGYGWSDKYVFYATLGMARMVARQYDPVMRWLYEDYEYYYGETYEYWNEDIETVGDSAGRGKWDPFYGAGFKAVFHDAGGFKVGMDLQWNQYKLDNETYNYYRYYDYGYAYDGVTDYGYGYEDTHMLTETDTTEYHAALIFSKKNKTFSPYGGVKLSSYETDYTGAWDSTYWDNYGDRGPDFEGSGTWTYTASSKDYVGLFFGIDCELTETFVINGEMRLGDESAMTVRMGWKF